MLYCEVSLLCRGVVLCFVGTLLVGVCVGFRWLGGCERRLFGNAAKHETSLRCTGIFLVRRGKRERKRSES